MLGISDKEIREGKRITWQDIADEVAKYLLDNKPHLPVRLTITHTRDAALRYDQYEIKHEEIYEHS